MYRNYHLSNTNPYAPDLPMFIRHLGSNWFTPSQAFLGSQRSLFQHTTRWRMCLPPWPPHPHPNRHFSVDHRPPDIWHRGFWRHPAPGPPFYGFSSKDLHLSSGLMDRADKEPPQKKRRNSPERRDRQSPPRGSSHILPMRNSVMSHNCWFRNDSTSPTPPGQVQTDPQKRSRSTEITRHWDDFYHHYKRPSQCDNGLLSKPFDFSVMSYNILSQDLLQDNAYLYRHCPLPVLDWNHRLPNILREVEEHDADILCLQEVQEDHYQKQIKPSLESLGYHSEYKRRTGGKSDGCAVSFKRDRFSLVSCHPVEYFRRGIPLLDRDNVGLVLLLRPLGGPAAGSGLCVANTHLLFNPRRGDIKLAQLAMLLAEISRVSGLQDTACPIILCGDFNSVPWSPLYSFIRESKLEYGGIPISKVSGQEQSPRGQRILAVPLWPQSLGINQRCQYETSSEKPTGDPSSTVTEEISSVSTKDPEEQASEAFTKPSIEHSLRLTSVYSHFTREGGQPEITTCHSRTATTVDYIFYSAARGDVSAQPEGYVAPECGLHLLARLSLVEEADLWTANMLPNEHNSSDHLPLLARFRLCC